jgi:hypothetical protein
MGSIVERKRKDGTVSVSAQILIKPKGRIVHQESSSFDRLGRTIPQAAAVSGYRSWQSLQRYTHLRKTGDKYKGWAGWECLEKR